MSPGGRHLRALWNTCLPFFLAAFASHVTFSARSWGTLSSLIWQHGSNYDQTTTSSLMGFPPLHPNGCRYPRLPGEKKEDEDLGNNIRTGGGFWLTPFLTSEGTFHASSRRHFAHFYELYHAFYGRWLQNVFKRPNVDNFAHDAWYQDVTLHTEFAQTKRELLNLDYHSVIKIYYIKDLRFIPNIKYCPSIRMCTYAYTLCTFKHNLYIVTHHSLSHHDPSCLPFSIPFPLTLSQFTYLKNSLFL